MTILPFHLPSTKTAAQPNYGERGVDVTSTQSSRCVMDLRSLDAPSQPSDQPLEFDLTPEERDQATFAQAQLRFEADLRSKREGQG